MALSYVAPPEEVPPVMLHIWQQTMRESIWHFNQVDGPDAPLNKATQVYIQSDRDMIARALNGAYTRIRRKLLYDLQPAWHSERIRVGHGSPLFLQSLATKWKRLQAFGNRATTLIQSAAPVVYSRVSTSTADDTATITVPTTLTDASQIQAFFQVADGAPSAANVRWQIMPLAVTLSGGNAIITGHRSLFVSPTLIWNIPYDPTDVNQITRHDASTINPADFVTAVDVYQVYPDPALAVTLVTDPILYQSTALTTALTSAGEAFIEDDFYGLYRIRVECGTCVRYPEWVQINYLAGCPMQDQDMDTDLGEAMVHLANTLMPQVPTQLADMSLASFEEDHNVAYSRASGGGGFVVQEQCPFGSQIGAQRAWMQVKDRLIIPAGKITR